MPDNNCQKIKLLKLMEILRQETDEEHPLKTAELCNRLVYSGISCDPRTLARDVKVLNQHGFEVMERYVARSKAYYVCDRSFSVPELKILIDAVQAASFITDKKSIELIEKLADLGGSHKGNILKSNIVKFNTRKHSNESVYYTVGFLEEAIQQKKRVSFRYFDLNENGERIYRKDGADYITEPVALVFNEDNYYLVAYSTKHENTTNYRVDRIDNVKILEEQISDQAQKMKNEVAKYTKSAFKMFDGEAETVTLNFDNKLIGAVYDKFGENTKMRRIDDRTIETNVQVRVSPTFFGWMAQFAGGMRITSPARLRESYSKHMSEINTL